MKKRREMNNGKPYISATISMVKNVSTSNIEGDCSGTIVPKRVIADAFM